jgi:transcriptional regulator with XRE-family HTH domain
LIFRRVSVILKDFLRETERLEAKGVQQYPVIDPVATGKNIVRLRQERGLSVRDLQAFFGFEEPQAIYKWQRGKSLPSVDNLYALGALLDVSMDEILVPTRPQLKMIVFEQQAEACCSDIFYNLAIKAAPAGRPMADRLKSVHPPAEQPVCKTSCDAADFTDRLFWIRQKTEITLIIYSGVRTSGGVRAYAPIKPAARQ